MAVHAMAMPMRRASDGFKSNRKNAAKGVSIIAIEVANTWRQQHPHSEVKPHPHDPLEAVSALGWEANLCDCVSVLHDEGHEQTGEGEIGHHAARHGRIAADGPRSVFKVIAYVLRRQPDHVEQHAERVQLRRRAGGRISLPA
jgi:hypothetical protein